MGDVRVDGANSPPVRSTEEMIGRFHAELISALPDRKERLRANPSGLEELEREVQRVFDRGAGLVIAGLMALVLKAPEFATATEQLRQEFSYPLAIGRNRQVRIRLLCGIVIWVSSLYCAPRKSWFRRTKNKVPGAYIELLPFGFGKGCSPGLQSRVARKAALCPSLQLAQQELERDACGWMLRPCGESQSSAGRGCCGSGHGNWKCGGREHCRPGRNWRANACRFKSTADEREFAGIYERPRLSPKKKMPTACRAPTPPAGRKSGLSAASMPTGVNRS
jgi:hypothetical protein